MTKKNTIPYTLILATFHILAKHSLQKVILNRKILSRSLIIYRFPYIIVATWKLN